MIALSEMVRIPATLLVLLAGFSDVAIEPRFQPTLIEDGHARPRAVLLAPDALLYVALSTANRVAVIDPRRDRPRLVTQVATGRFPQALAALPDGGVLVSCRFDPDLGVIQRGAHGAFRYRRLPAGPEHGHRGVVVSPRGRVAYVASPPVHGVKVVALDGSGVRQVMPTGLSPRALHLAPDPRSGAPLLLVASYIDHAVTAHPIAADGSLGPAAQKVATDAPVHDLAVIEGALWLLTHEDRPVDRAHVSVEGLDSVALVVPAAVSGPMPFADPGKGRRRALNLTEHAAEPVVKLDAVAFDGARGRVAIAGSGSDNVALLHSGAARSDDTAGAAAGAVVVRVGTAPAALAFLPDGRLVSADRLSDTISFLDPNPATAGDGDAEPRVVAEVELGQRPRRTPAELGEVLFHGRALVPRNVARGPLSIYACSACHDEGHVDGRVHPAKRNRFRSMTKTCRGIATTAPYLSLGDVPDLAGFADNIVATHAQGALEAPDTYDRYPVTLRVRSHAAFNGITLGPEDVRAALGAYMAVLPPEPSPFVRPGSGALEPLARRGLGIFLERCATCHQPVGNTRLGNRVAAEEIEARLSHGEVTFAGRGLYDVGTPVLGQGGNNPPSLRGVWDAAPYLSDGSARTLDELLARTDPEADRVHEVANARPSPRMSADDRAALRAFLLSL